MRPRLKKPRVLSECRRAIAQPCDVSVEAQTEAAAAAATQAFGRIDILVSGAAPHDPSGTVLETSLADWNHVLAVNLTGSLLLSRAALPYMIEGGGGSIIFIASQLGRVGSAGRAAYTLSPGRGGDAEDVATLRQL